MKIFLSILLMCFTLTSCSSSDDISSSDNEVFKEQTPSYSEGIDPKENRVRQCEEETGMSYRDCGGTFSGDKVED